MTRLLHYADIYFGWQHWIFRVALNGRFRLVAIAGRISVEIVKMPVRIPEPRSCPCSTLSYAFLFLLKASIPGSLGRKWSGPSVLLEADNTRAALTTAGGKMMPSLAAAF